MEEPQIQHLPYQRRQRFFWVLVLVFLFALPALIFYTTGYRLSFENEETVVVTTGGVYITTDNLEVDVYLDAEKVERPRLFRSAYYIQNIAAGQRRVVVQRPDLQTWVKDLPVDPYLVIEAAAFNMPAEPHIRPIAEYTDEAGELVYLVDEVSTSTDLFPAATTTVPYTLATSTATSAVALLLNEEFVFVQSLFGTTSTSTQSVFERFMNEMDRFRFSTTTPAGEELATTTPEEFIEQGGIRLVEREAELYATWVGSTDSIPYYFCVTDNATTTTALRYGEHVAVEVERLRLSTSTPLILDGNRVCRPEIKLDRLRQDVFYYDFFPNNADLVVLQLEDGVYVTEIDDRAWQNSQLVYPGTDLQVVVENDSIYIKEGNRFFEVITEIELEE